MTVKRKNIALCLILMLIIVDLLNIVVGYGVVVNIKAQEATQLDIVYWNPKNTDELTVDGVVKKHAGKDSNSGEDSEHPVFTIEKAIAKAAYGATIYCMNEWMLTGEERTIDSGNKEITIEQYSTYSGNIAKVEQGAGLQLKNITINPKSVGTRVIAIEAGGVLTIGENVEIKKQGEIYFSGAMEQVKPLQVTALDLEDSIYHISYESTPVQAQVICEAASSLGQLEKHFAFSEAVASEWELQEKSAGKWAFYKVVSYNAAIYLSGSGSDDNSGDTSTTAVKTFARAKELMQKKCNGSGIIYICGMVNIEGEETWDLGNLKDQIVIKNTSISITASVDVLNGGSLSLKNIHMVYDGSYGNQLVKVEKGGTLTVGKDARLEHCNGTGSAVYNAGTTTIDGGVIESKGTQNNYAVYNYTYGTLYATSGYINSENGKAVGHASNATLFELDGTHMQIDGNMTLAKKIQMSNADIIQDYGIVINSTVFLQGAVAIENVTEADMEHFFVDPELFLQIDCYNEAGAVYEKVGVFLDPVNGSDSKGGTKPSKAVKTLAKAMELYQNSDKEGKVLYIMDTVSVTGTESYDGLNQETSIIKHYGTNINALWDIQANGILELKNFTIDTKNTVVSRTMPVVIVNGGKFHSIHTTIKNNSNGTNGGAIRVTAGEVVLDEESILENNVGKFGAAIYMTTGKISIKGDSILRKNTTSASGYGGAVYMLDGTLELDGVTIEENTSVYNGGAFYVAKGAVTISAGTTIEKNIGGYPIYIGANAQLEVIDGIIKDNGTSNNLSDDLYILGNLTIHENAVIEDICYLLDGNKPIQVVGTLGTQSIMLTYTSTFSGKHLIEGVDLSLSNFIEKAYREEEEKTPNLTLASDGTYISVVSNRIYLDGVSGNDTRDGTSPTTAVKTFEKAKELLQARGKGDIEICKTVTIQTAGADDVLEWSLPKQNFPWEPKIIIGTDCTTYGVEVKKGTLCLKDICLDGNRVALTYMLYLNGGNAEMGEGAILSNAGGRGVHAVAASKFRMKEGEIYGCQKGAISSVGTLEILGGSIHENNAPSTGLSAGITISGGTCLIQDALIEENVTEAIGNYTGGGGIYSFGDCTIRGQTIIRNNKVISGGGSWMGGGGLYVRSGSCTIEGSVLFEGNQSGSFGGAIYHRVGTLTLDDVQFLQNSASNNGGAFYSEGAPCMIRNCTFLQNDSGANGGAVYQAGTNASDLTIECCLFEENTAKLGGAICLSSTNNKVFLKECRFLRNKGSGGAGIYQQDAIQVVTAEDCYWEGNISTGAGGGATLSNAVVMRGTFVENQATTNGGGLNITKGTVMDSTFVRNEARFGGGLIAGSGSEIKNCVIHHNKAFVTSTSTVIGGNGGGLYIGGNALVKECKIYQNMTQGQSCSVNSNNANGGGIYISSGTVNIDECEIYQNQTQILESIRATSGNGGGIYIAGGTVTVNSNIYQNQTYCYKSNIDYCGNGGGIYLNGGKCILTGTVQNNKVVAKENKHTYSGNGGGISAYNGTFIIRGDILNNTVETIDGVSGKGGGISLFYKAYVTLENGTISGNQAEIGGAIYDIANSSPGALLLQGGTIANNQTTISSEQAIYLATANCQLEAGKCNITESFYLSSSSVSLILSKVKTSNPMVYQIALGSTFVAGSVVVKPDGVEVSDAGDYKEWFSVNKTDHVVECYQNNLILSRVFFLDGLYGSDSTVDGATPETAYKTFEALKTAVGKLKSPTNPACTIFICGTVTITKTTTWSLNANQSICRYTGTSIGEAAYDAFAGDLVVVESGGNLTLNGISVRGKVQDSLTYVAEGSLLRIEEGGTLSMKKTGTVSTYVGGNESSLVGGAIYQGGMFEVSGVVQVDGEIYLEEEKYITVLDSVVPQTPFLLHLAKIEDGTSCAYYVTGVTQENKKDYLLVNQLEYIYSLAANPQSGYIEMVKKGIFYVDGKAGSDQNSGEVPDDAFKSLQKAYEKAVTNREYVVYVVDAITLTEDITFEPDRYTDAQGVHATTEGGTLTIKRYSCPGSKPSWKETYTGSLFVIEDGLAVFQDMGIDGHSQAVTMGTSQVNAPGVVAHGSLFNITDHGILTLAGTTTLEQNKNKKEDNSTTSGYGGAILNEGTLFLQDEVVISDTTAEQGDALYQNGTCYLQGTVSMTGSIFLGKVGSSNRVLSITGQGVSLPHSLILALEEPMVDSVLVSYETAQAASVLNSYVLEEKNKVFYTIVQSGDQKKLVLRWKQAIYVDGVEGSDSNSGDSSKDAVKTLKQAYTKAQALCQASNADAVLYLVNTVTIEENVSMSGHSYEAGADSISLGSYEVRMLRYVKASGESNEKATNYDALLCIKGTLFLEDITLDGQKVGGPVTIGRGTAAQNALLEVEAKGMLYIKDGTVLKNNQNQAVEGNPKSGYGGAVRNEGTLTIEGGTIAQNEAKEGSGIYQAGKLNFGGRQLYMEEQEIYLAKGAGEHPIQVRDLLPANATVWLDLETFENGSDVLIFTAELKSKMAEEKKKYVLQDAKEYYLIESSKEGKDTTVMVRKELEILSHPADRLVGVDDTYSLYFNTTVNENVTEAEVSLYKDGEKMENPVLEKNTSTKTIRTVMMAAKENVGTYQFVLKLDGRIVTGEPFVLSEYEVTYEGSEAYLLAKSSGSESHPTQDSARLKVYSGYKKEMKLSLGNIEISGVGDAFNPTLVAKSQMQQCFDTWDSIQSLQFFAFEITAKPDSAQAVTADVTDMTQWNAVKQRTIESQGVADYRITMTNANGINSKQSGSFRIGSVQLSSLEEGKSYGAGTAVSVQIQTETSNMKIVLTKDEQPRSGEKVVLKKNGISYELTETEEGSGIYVGDVPAGQYTLYIGEESGGTQCGITNEEANEEVLDYVTVAYEAEEDCSGEAPKIQIALSGSAIILPENSFEKSGYRFLGWMVEEGAVPDELSLYQPGNVCVVTKAAIRFMAVWEKIEETPAPPTQIPETEVPATETPQPSATSTLTPIVSPVVSPQPTPIVATTNPPTSEAPTTQMPVTKEPTTKPPVTQIPATKEPTVKPPVTQVPATKEPTAKPSVTQIPTTKEPTVTPLVTQIPTTKEPTAKPSVTQIPETSEPTAKPSVTQIPATKEPTAKPRVSQIPVTKAPTVIPSSAPVITKTPIVLPSRSPLVTLEPIITEEPLTTPKILPSRKPTRMPNESTVSPIDIEQNKPPDMVVITPTSSAIQDKHKKGIHYGYDELEGIWNEKTATFSLMFLLSTGIIILGTKRRKKREKK